VAFFVAVINTVNNTTNTHDEDNQLVWIKKYLIQ